MDTRNGTITPDNLLATDPELYEESFKHEDDEYVWPERAKKYLESGEIPDDLDIGELDEDSGAFTAAGEPVEAEEVEFPPLYFTVDEDGNVLELVRADEEGLFIRIDKRWVDISDEDEFPTVYEQEMHFANDDAVAKWDAEFEDKAALKLKDIENYLIK